jgi:hypothetical protein
MVEETRALQEKGWEIWSMRAGYYVYVSPNGQTFTTIADAPKHGKDDEQKGDGEEAASPAAGSSPLQSLKNYDQPDAAGAAGVKPGAQLKYPHLLEIAFVLVRRHHEDETCFTQDRVFNKNARL